jgi:pimeloyl-ACP methyl ester carboxylesterase
LSTFNRRQAIGCAAGVALVGGGIAEDGFVAISGIDQWISVRGRSLANPAVVFLHGGPAEAQSPFLSLFADWERDFTVVQWDQRGAGKTFGRNGASTPGMTLDRMADDAIEVCQYACRRLGKARVIVVGHSWGALLGQHAFRRNPAPFAAFVGTGQPVSWARTVAGQYAFALAAARAEPNPAAVTALEALGDFPPTNFAKYSVLRGWLNHYLPASDQAYLALQRRFIGAPPFPTSGDVGAWVAGGEFSIPRLLPAILSADLPALGYAMPIPYFVVEGRDDHITPVEAASDYASHIRAPAKGLDLIDGGHFAVFTNPRQFVRVLTAKVRRLA